MEVIDMKLTGKVLIVDDEEDIRTILSHYCREIGLDTDEAENGEKAYEMVLKNDYTHILTDLTMPKMRGEELIKRLKDIPDFKAKVYILTGLITKTEKDIGISVDGFMHKPFSAEKIYKLLS